VLGRSKHGCMSKWGLACLDAGIELVGCQVIRGDSAQFVWSALTQCDADTTACAARHGKCDSLPLVPALCRTASNGHLVFRLSTHSHLTGPEAELS
jgi:hypothetical protein